MSKTLQVSFLNLDGEQDLSDLGCYVYLKSENGHSRFIENLILSNQQNRAFIPITNNQDKIQFIVKRILFNKLVGSLSIQVQEFKTLKTDEWSQWYQSQLNRLTLFDTIDDDNYDGQLVTDNDKESPRICLNFRLLAQEVGSPSPMKEQKYSVSSDSVYGYSATPSHGQQQETPVVNQFVTMGHKSNSKSSSKQQDQQYSPQFELQQQQSYSKAVQRSESSCQVNILSSELQQSFILRLELEKMSGIQKKYDQSKKALQKMQEEYEELIKEQNQHIEDKDHDLADISIQNCQLRSQLESLEHDNRVRSAEIDTFRQLQTRPQEQQFHTFQQPQQNVSSKTKLIIDDMAKQLKYIKVQLQQSEEHRTSIETQYLGLSDQFKQIINENTVSRVQLLRQMQTAEDTQSKQNNLLVQLTDKCKKQFKMLDQKLNENSFLEREVKRLTQDCEWGQKTIYNLNQSLEDMRLKHLEEYKNMQDELNSTASDLNTSETDRNIITQNFQIKSTQLDSYQSVVGTLESYMGLLTKCQENEQKKASIQLQLTEQTSKTNDEIVKWNQSLQRQRSQLKDEYDLQMEKMRAENEAFKDQGQDQTNQIKALQTETLKLSSIINQLKEVNQHLMQQNTSLQLIESQKELIEIQMIKLTEEYITKTQQGLELNSNKTNRTTTKVTRQPKQEDRPLTRYSQNFIPTYNY